MNSPTEMMPAVKNVVEFLKGAQSLLAIIMILLAGIATWNTLRADVTELKKENVEIRKRANETDERISVISKLLESQAKENEKLRKIVEIQYNQVAAVFNGQKMAPISLERD